VKLITDFLYKLSSKLNQVQTNFLLSRYFFHGFTIILPLCNGERMVKDCRSYGKTQKGYKTWSNQTRYFTVNHPILLSRKRKLRELIHIYFLVRNIFPLDHR